MNNSITIIGHVGQKPKVVSFGDTGNKLVKFSVAVKEFSSNTDEEKTLWLDVDAWNGLGERIMQTVKKGREVMLTGRLAISVFTREENGVKTEVHKPVLKLSGFHLCGAKPKEEEASAESSEQPKAKTRKSA